MSDRDDPLGRGAAPREGDVAGGRAAGTTRLELVHAGGIELRLERPADAESLIDEAAFEADEFLPYWAERWPSGVALADLVAGLDVTGVRVLELGCGLALPSLVAARGGADVVATDWSSDAIDVLRRNASRNGATITAVTADWRDLETFAALGRVDLLLGADLLYEERNVAPILALLRLLGAPALIADPGRRHADGFFDAVRTDGWSVVTVADPRLRRGGIHRLEPPPARWLIGNWRAAGGGHDQAGRRTYLPCRPEGLDGTRGW